MGAGNDAPAALIVSAKAVPVVKRLENAASEIAKGLSDGTLPPSIRIRIKPLSEELKRRSLRTFDLFLTRMLDRTGGVFPPNFVVTLPKITSAEQVAALASACDAFEYWRELPAGSLKFEALVPS